MHFAKLNKKLSIKEDRELLERVAKHQQDRERKEKEKAATEGKIRQKDRERFNKASEKGESPYLHRKHVKAHGVRFEVRANETHLLIPMMDENGQLQTIQVIHPIKRLIEGKLKDKFFTKGVSVKGLFLVLGTITDGELIRVSEGYATAASCYESTRCTVPHVVSFSDVAYSTVVPILRRKYPNSHIQICADGSKDPNIESSGIKEAKNALEAIRNINCSYVVPTFKEGNNKDAEGKLLKDFNDLMIAEGKEEVKKQLEHIPESTNSTANVIETAEEKTLFLDAVVTSLTRNERGDAELFLHQFKDKYVFDCSEGKNGEFYFWNGSRWQLDKEKQRYKDMEYVAQFYEKEAAKFVGDDNKPKRELLVKRAFSLRSAKRCKAVFEFVAIDIPFKGEWDHCPGKLPCLNGIIDLKTGELSEHKPEYYLRKICPTNYNLQAKRSLFNKFLNDITLDDAERKSFLNRIFGSALYGDGKEEKTYYLYGKDGRNGKGTLCKQVERTLGGFARTFPSEMILLQRNPPSSSTPRPEKANLQGVRFAIFSEINKGRKIDAAELKNLSGGDTISCRRLFSNEDIQIQPSHTMFIQCNDKPVAPSDDGALWARNILFDFKARFVENPKEPHERKLDESFKENLDRERERGFCFGLLKVVSNTNAKA